MTTEDSMVDRFFYYFCDEITKINISSQPTLHKKLLFASLLDCLGKSRYPKKGNDRILYLIDEYSGWRDKDRVSLVQLGIFLERNPDYSSELLSYVRLNLNKMASGTIYHAEIDPFINDILVSKNIKYKELFEKFRYADLFYSYRHLMIHEFREPGHPIEMSQDPTTPYYHSCMDHEMQNNWELVFPLTIFRDICQGCLDNLRTYFKHTQKDPYEAYNFGNLWVSENKLNKIILKQPK